MFRRIKIPQGHILPYEAPQLFNFNTLHGVLFFEKVIKCTLHALDKGADCLCVQSMLDDIRQNNSVSANFLSPISHGFILVLGHLFC